MFSANENIALRQHKRRVIQYVEDCIPPGVLDLGATAMAMQVSCQAPGCVPLETVIMILFPKSDTQLIPEIPESIHGGTLKTKVLLPMAEITQQHVNEALPPPLGTRSMEKLCLQARDVMLAQITQLVGEEDTEGRHLMADYLTLCLQEYKLRDCIAPDYGEPFDEPVKSEENNVDVDATTNEIDTTIEQESKDVVPSNKPTVPAGNFVFSRNDNGLHISDMSTTSGGTESTNNNDSAVSTASTVNGKPKKEDVKTTNDDKNSTTTSTSSSTTPSNMDWRRSQTVERSINTSSQSIIQRLSEREHAPGVRMAGCPCCDPDNVQNYVDSIMML